MTYLLAAAVEGPTKVLLTLFVMLAAAKLLAEISERLRQPSVVGEILAGVIIGPSVLGFLVNIGLQLRLEVSSQASVIVFAILVTLIAVITKLAGCGLGAKGLSWKEMSQVGMGMVPRGEVGIVVAQIGLGLAVINDALYGVVLMMAVATTLIAPPFLRILYASERKTAS